MVERVKITVTPSAKHPTILDVKDAMRQVLHFFEFLSDDQDEVVVWNLVNATTNSPFTAEGEAVSLRAGVDVSVVARAQKIEAAETLNALIEGRRPLRRLPKAAESVARQFFLQNVNGIGTTRIDLGAAADEVVVTPGRAQSALKVISEGGEGTFSLLPANREREEIGSLEGVLLEVGTHHNHPAFCLVERLSNREVWCRVPKEFEREFAEETSFGDVWGKRRVRVRGRIKYDSSGKVLYVVAHGITGVEPNPTNLDDLYDPHFTGGRSIEEYIEALREGNGN